MERSRLHSPDVEDNFGHHINYLRLSVTDRCNERCRYCMPDEEQDWLPRQDQLTYDEILRVARAGVSLGVEKFRVTGGEPLTRPGVVDFLKELASLPNIQSLGLSTNGTLLARPASRGASQSTAEALYAAGVTALNLSLDSLDAEKYRKTTGRDYLPQFLDGIEAAKNAGFQRIRLNTVLMRHQTEHELWDLLEFANKYDALIRFVELMPVSTDQMLSDENFLPFNEARRIIEFKHGQLIPRPDYKTAGPSVYYQVPTTGQIVGFIGALTNLHFCESCNKLRLTSDGKLRPCLGSHLEFDMREVLRDPATTDDDIRRFFLNVVANKPEQHEFRDNYQPGRRMIAIGG